MSAGFAVFIVAYDGTGKAHKCDQCGKTPAATAFGHSEVLPFGGKQVWHIFALLCEECSHKAIEMSGKLRTSTRD